MSETGDQVSHDEDPRNDRVESEDKMDIGSTQATHGHDQPNNSIGGNDKMAIGGTNTVDNKSSTSMNNNVQKENDPMSNETANKDEPICKKKEGDEHHPNERERVEVEDKFTKYREMRKEKEQKKPQHGGENMSDTIMTVVEKGTDNTDCSKSSKDEYEVEKILDRRLGKYGDIKYLVKWKGRSWQHNTWKRKESSVFLSCRQTVENYEKRFKDRDQHDINKETDNKLDNTEGTSNVEDITEYVVERIIDKRIGKNRQAEYLIKWKDQPDSKNSWKDIDHFQCSNDLIEAYEKERKQNARKIVVGIDIEQEEEGELIPVKKKRKEPRKELVQKEEPEYVVKKIADKRVATDGRTEYLIKWKGFAAKFDSWEPKDELLECEDIIQEFEKQRKLKKQKEKEKKRKKLSNHFFW